VGVIALVGLAAETGIVMIVYLDGAFERRMREGRMHDKNDVIWAVMAGTVQRVRPKLMTVSTMMLGLVPLLWSEGTGADVMKRIAAPMVGGLLTSAFSPSRSSPSSTRTGGCGSSGMVASAPSGA
jgi:Cu(I)/Ag(I) efflux system membrane protein CusA/SilA